MQRLIKTITPILYFYSCINTKPVVMATPQNILEECIQQVRYNSNNAELYCRMALMSGKKEALIELAALCYIKSLEIKATEMGTTDKRLYYTRIRQPLEEGILYITNYIKYAKKENKKIPQIALRRARELESQLDILDWEEKTTIQ